MGPPGMGGPAMGDPRGYRGGGYGMPMDAYGGGYGGVDPQMLEFQTNALTYLLDNTETSADANAAMKKQMQKVLDNQNTIMDMLDAQDPVPPSV